MAQQSKGTSKGTGVFTLLTLLFVALKLTGFIAWSWVWVLSPLWISVLLLLLFVVILMFKNE